MAKLVLSMDGLVLKEVALDKARLTIGRKPYNDIQIDNLAISGEHAAIVTILKDSFLEDLNSTNGTLVNGQSIKKHVLRNNDVIELGKYRLKYMADSSSVDPGIEHVAATPAPRAEAVARAVDYGRDSKAAGLVSQTAYALQAAALQLLNGPNVGKSLELSKDVTTLGKPGVQVAVIARRPLGYYITHIEGEQPSLLNGRPLAGPAQPLADHDVVEISGVKMEFFLKH